MQMPTIHANALQPLRKERGQQVSETTERMNRGRKMTETQSG
jgi:hypothetical protein